ncbi:HD-GYP domain-containing protein [Oceanobacillus manasiensis]|uniref:HD-GYP domain-containing protein n=1 Tax=Oceanobacillus manasiensis TaxID=586413 RepID=UPI0005AB19D4|nr:HD-GYP domain-containing protein [Oceanobacillus manasiensis]
MRVKASQLVPGCVLLREIKGKTNRAIIPKGTVLTERHITVIKKYLVESVDVSSKLAEGESYTPEQIEEVQQVQQPDAKKEDVDLPPFHVHYEQTVQAYKKLFENWKNGAPLDMPYVRKLIIPLIKRMDDISSAVYTMHHYSNKRDYIFYHSVAVGILSAFLARKMGYPSGDWLQIGIAGFLCDAGMAKVEHNLLHKAGTLSTAQMNDLKKHPTYSYRMVEQIPTIKQSVKLAILQHHERSDGSGYPLGLTSGKIHKVAKIIAVCDMYHAMTCERIYKEKQSPFLVIEELQKEQFSTLDPEVVTSFVESMTHFSIGTKIRLSNNKLGEIVFIDAKHPTRPMVRLEGNEDIIALQKTEMFIEEIVGIQ